MVAANAVVLGGSPLQTPVQAWSWTPRGSTVVLSSPDDDDAPLRESQRRPRILAYDDDDGVDDKDSGADQGRPSQSAAVVTSAAAVEGIAVALDAVALRCMRGVVLEDDDDDHACLTPVRSSRLQARRQARRRGGRRVVPLSPESVESGVDEDVSTLAAAFAASTPATGTEHRTGQPPCATDDDAHPGNAASHSVGHSSAFSARHLFSGRRVLLESSPSSAAASSSGAPALLSTPAMVGSGAGSQRRGRTRTVLVLSDSDSDSDGDGDGDSHGDGNSHGDGDGEGNSSGDWESSAHGPTGRRSGCSSASPSRTSSATSKAVPPAPSGGPFAGATRRRGKGGAGTPAAAGALPVGLDGADARHPIELLSSDEEADEKEEADWGRGAGRRDAARGRAAAPRADSGGGRGGGGQSQPRSTTTTPRTGPRAGARLPPSAAPGGDSLCVATPPASGGPPSAARRTAAAAQPRQPRPAPAAGALRTPAAAPPTSARARANARRELVASVPALYARLNALAFGGRLPSDLPIVWSQTLRRTAGLTKFSTERRAPLALAGGGVAGAPAQRRVARIELAAKVLDSPERLESTLLHELCHAAAWLLDGQARPPHGPHFWAWANRAMAALPGVAVTTCHAYAIHCRHRWECVDCGQEYGRHSKSLDVAKHRCGRAQCAGRLVYAGAFESDGTPVRARAPSAFSVFVGEHFASAKRRAGAGATHAAVMAALGEQWREHKRTEAGAAGGREGHEGASGGEEENRPPRAQGGSGGARSLARRRASPRMGGAAGDARGAGEKEAGSEAGSMIDLAADSDDDYGDGGSEGADPSLADDEQSGLGADSSGVRVLDAMFAELDF